MRRKHLYWNIVASVACALGVASGWPGARVQARSQSACPRPEVRLWGSRRPVRFDGLPVILLGGLWRDWKSEDERKVHSSSREDGSIEPFTSTNSTVICLCSPSRVDFDCRILSTRCLGVYERESGVRDRDQEKKGPTLDRRFPAPATQHRTCRRTSRQPRTAFHMPCSSARAAAATLHPELTASTVLSTA